MVYGDGYKGLPNQAPFDAIIVTAGCPEVPKSLLEQLTIGGRLVIPLGEKDQIMTRFTKTAEKLFNRKTFGNFKFVPLLKDKN